MDENECVQKLSFLFSGSCTSLPESYVKLRSILNLHSTNIAEIFNLRIPKHFNSNNMICPYCYTHCNLNFNCFKLLPSTGKKFKRQILNKSKLVSDTTTDGASKEVFCTRNKLVLNCQVCTKKSKFIMEKPENYKKKNQKQNTSLVFKKRKTKKKKNQNLLEGNLIHKKKNNKIKSKKNRKKGFLISTSNSFAVSKPVTANNNCKENKNWSCTRLGSKELRQKRESMSQMNSKVNFSINIFKKNNNAKKKQLNHLRKAMKNEAKVHKNSLKDLLTVIN